MIRVSFFAISTVGLFTALATADDWPQWMGPNRDGRWAETGIVEAFPPPKKKKKVV